MNVTARPPALTGRRVLVVGAGALGSVYGACLARGGLEVTLLAREQHARAIRDQGGLLVTEASGASWTVALGAEWRPDAVTNHDLVLLATKAHDSAAALAGLDHLRGGVEIAVSVQNGVAKDAVLARWCGAERVLGAVSMVGATLEAPGHVRLSLAGATYVGELPAGTSARAGRLVEQLRSGGLDAHECEQVLAAEWGKLVHAAPVMALTARTRLPLHAILLDEGWRRHYVEAVREGIAVAAAAGVDVPDLAGMFPVRTIADAPLAEALQVAEDRGRRLVAAGAVNVRVSMLVDVERGRPLELDGVHRFLVAEADRTGVAAPRLHGDLAALERLSEGRGGQA